MSAFTNEPDEIDEQVVEDERAAAFQEFREREELTRGPVDLADV
jgi:hypothetical protein